MTLMRGIAPKSARRRSSTAAGQQTKLVQFTRELNEALDQHTATAEVSKRPHDSATRTARAFIAGVVRFLRVLNQRETALATLINLM